MKAVILKRIAAIESKVQAVETPSLVMIHYDDQRGCWVVVEHFYKEGAKKPSDFKRKGSTFQHLREYCFQPAFKGRVIIDAFGNHEPDIEENVYGFNIEDLRKGLQKGDTGALYIDAIRDTENGSNIVEMTVCAKDLH